MYVTAHVWNYVLDLYLCQVRSLFVSPIHFRPLS
jgi:hypothetical protein